MDEQDLRLKIVIVEDNEYLSEIYKTRLEIIGYHCFTATDGEMALRIIEREKPALVLLDMMIPKIAGDEVLKRMRAADWGKDIRVFIISNLNEIDAPAGLRDLGIEGYAVKANLSDDDIDKLVDKILTPPDQEESLEIDS
jgi:DNA-binding response OmpR family regulator